MPWNSDGWPIWLDVTIQTSITPGQKNGNADALPQVAAQRGDQDNKEEEIEIPSLWVAIRAAQIQPAALASAVVELLYTLATGVTTFIRFRAG